MFSAATKQYMTNYCVQVEGIIIMGCPGSTVNHNKIYHNVAIKKISDTEFHVYAVRDVSPGKESFI